MPEGGMCVLFDMAWKPLLLAALVISILYLLSRPYGPDREVRPRSTAAPLQPDWRRLLVLGGQGAVALIMLALFIMALVCVGSPGDIKGIVPN